LGFWDGRKDSKGRGVKGKKFSKVSQSETGGEHPDLAELGGDWSTMEIAIVGWGKVGRAYNSVIAPDLSQKEVAR